MRRAAAITLFFTPQQTNVRTSHSRCVSLRQRASASIAPSAAGGSRYSRTAWTPVRPFALIPFGHSKQTPRNREKNPGLSREVDLRADCELIAA